jgi:6-phospho-3-hexuloisomerase
MPIRKPLRAAAALVDTVLDEQRRVFAGLSAAGFDRFCRAIDAAGRVFLYGVGRNGLMLQAFAMRLGHLGIDAHFVGQLRAPPAGQGDLLVTAVALGSLPSADAIAATARAAGARVAAITARPRKVRGADLVLTLRAQTMDDPPRSVLALGGAFELSLHLACEAAVARLMAMRKVGHAALRARHTNLL